MKYLKKYKLFLEDFEIEDSDESDVKMSKNRLNDIKKQISHFKSNKSKVDKLFKDDNVTDEIDKVITLDDKKNPFLISYASVARMNKKIEDLKNKETKKSIEINELKDRLSDASDDVIEDIKGRINDVNKQISDIKKDIQETSRKIPELEKEHQEKINKTEKDIKDWISKIQ